MQMSVCHCAHWCPNIDTEGFRCGLITIPQQIFATETKNSISEEDMRKLMVVRQDIVHTIQQVMDIVSQYAGTTLPEPVRNQVWGFILKLLHRWASKAAAVVPNIVNMVGDCETVAAAVRWGAKQQAALRECRTGGLESGQKLGPPSRAASPHSSPHVAWAPLNRHGETPENGGGADAGSVSHGAVLVAAQWILTLATESLDIMRVVTGVVKDRLDHADVCVCYFSDPWMLLTFTCRWVGRLCTVGIQCGVQEGEDTKGYEFELNRPPTNTSLASRGKLLLPDTRTAQMWTGWPTTSLLSAAPPLRSPRCTSHPYKPYQIQGQCKCKWGNPPPDSHLQPHQEAPCCHVIGKCERSGFHVGPVTTLCPFPFYSCWQPLNKLHAHHVIAQHELFPATLWKCPCTLMPADKWQSEELDHSSLPTSADSKKSYVQHSAGWRWGSSTTQLAWISWH